MAEMYLDRVGKKNFHPLISSLNLNGICKDPDLKCSVAGCAVTLLNPYFGMRCASLYASLTIVLYLV